MSLYDNRGISYDCGMCDSVRVKHGRDDSTVLSSCGKIVVFIVTCVTSLFDTKSVVHSEYVIAVTAVTLVMAVAVAT